MRDWNNWTLGMNFGVAGTHWAAASWRFLPWDFQIRTRVTERYGESQFVEGLIAQDWGVTYEELEPFYDRFEKIAGTAGKAGVINNIKEEGGNPFEGSRSSEFPAPPLVRSRWNNIFHEKATEMGYHPFPVPAGTISVPYTNALGINMAPCMHLLRILSALWLRQLVEIQPECLRRTGSDAAGKLHRPDRIRSAAHQ